MSGAHSRQTEARAKESKCEGGQEERHKWHRWRARQGPQKHPISDQTPEQGWYYGALGDEGIFLSIS